MAGELARQLRQFPFTKLKPHSFRVEIAGLTEQELEKCPVRIWIETQDIGKVLSLVGVIHTRAVYPHLNLIYVETYADRLPLLVASDVVRSVWNDLPVKAGGCVVTRVYRRAPIVASRSYGGAR